MREAELGGCACVVGGLCDLLASVLYIIINMMYSCHLRTCWKSERTAHLALHAVAVQSVHSILGCKALKAATHFLLSRISHHNQRANFFLAISNHPSPLLPNTVVARMEGDSITSTTRSPRDQANMSTPTLPYHYRTRNILTNALTIWPTLLSWTLLIIFTIIYSLFIGWVLIVGHPFIGDTLFNGPTVNLLLSIFSQLYTILLVYVVTGLLNY